METLAIHTQMLTAFWFNAPTDRRLLLAPFIASILKLTLDGWHLILHIVTLLFFSYIIVISPCSC